MLKRPLLVAIVDAVLVNLCIVSVFSIRFLGSVPKRNITAYQHTWYYITAVFILLFYLQGIYDNDENDDGIAIFFKVFSGVTFGTVSLMALTFVSRDFAFPRTVIMISYILMVVLFGLWHVFLHSRFIAGFPKRRVVLFGGTGRLDHLEKCIGMESSRYEFRGSIPGDQPEELRTMLSTGGADCIVIADDVPGGHELAFDLFLKYPNATIFLMPKVSDIIVGAMHQTVIWDVPLIAFSRRNIIGRYYLIKRVMDIAVSFFGLLILSPVFALVAAAIKLTSAGPVFYLQGRVGRWGGLFRIIKFRTMILGAEEPTGPVLSNEADPRVTGMGQVLRRLKIDEMPQLINVLKGEMSLVGPRPERENFVQLFEKEFPAYVFRKQVLPGMTGLAQVCGRYETDPSLKLKFDLIYIYNYRPWKDIAIIYQTFQFVLRENI
jgi:exopolysaccharide biosynthesis polyprenyl glycosylphosphotransferase